MGKSPQISSLSEPIVCVVPARLGSTRFPQKPLALIAGIPMIVRTLQQVSKAQCFDQVICATDSPEIVDVVTKAGFEATLTPTHFATGSDRVAWVAEQRSFSWVVNVQGDEPLISTELLRDFSQKLLSCQDGWLTSACPLLPEWVEKKSVVKVKVDKDLRALEFAREISSAKGWLRHTGVYGYSLNQLHLFQNSPQSLSEKKLSLEQLRVFPNVPFDVVLHDELSHSVDIPEDVAIVEGYLHNMVLL